MIEIPYQLVAKGFTEALGRNPSPQELVSHQQALQAGGCNGANISAWTRYMLSGTTEPQLASLTPKQRVQTAYRLLLNRDPDQAGWDYYSTLPFPKAIGDIQRSPEYRANVIKLCNSKGKGYGWGATPLDTAVPDTALRAQLAAALPGQTVVASGRIAVSSPLVIPIGVTLTSVGAHYTQQATLLRDSRYVGGVVELMADAKLTNIVVDGRGGDLGYTQQAMNIQVRGSRASVLLTQSKNPAGWTALFCSPHDGLVDDVTISSNTLIGYNTSRNGKNPAWSDGISVACRSATVNNNYVLDMTDVGIIVFESYERNPRVMGSNNAVIQVGNDTFGMIGIDQLNTTPADFTRTTFGGNLLATMGATRARTGIADGVKTWSADRVDIFGKGANYLGNYGYVQWEQFAFVTDAGLRSSWEPGINFFQMNYKGKCPVLKYATTGLDRTEGCL